MRRLLIAAGLLLLAHAAHAADPEGLSIESPVLGPDGKGLAGVRVELRPVLRSCDPGVPEPVAAEPVVTGPDGWFRFPVPSAGPWHMILTAAGFPPLDSGVQMILGEETVDPVWIHDAGSSWKPVPVAPLPDAQGRRPCGRLKFRTLSGRVVDEGTGRPVAGARVWSEADPGLVVVTNAAGAYRLPWTPGAPTHLWAKAVRYFATESPFVVEGRRTALPALPALPLWPVRTLEGVVVRPDGQPVPNAEVRVSGRSQSKEARTRTSAQGRFGAIVFLDDDYDVLAVSPDPGLAPDLVAATLLKGARGVSGIRLVLRPGRTAYGRIVDERGRPVATARVGLTPNPVSLVESAADALAVTLQAAETDGDGRFEIPGLPAGWYDLAVSRPGFLPGWEPAREVPEGAPRVDLGTVRLRRGATVSGWVTGPDREPLAGAGVWMPESPGVEGTVTGPDGRFTLEGVDPGDAGTSPLLVCRPDRGSAILVFAEILEEPIEVVLKPAARLLGRVVGEDGEPVAGAQVSASQPGTGSRFPKTPCPLPYHAEGLTDADGRFVFGPLGDGTFVVSVRKASLTGLAPVTVELQAGADAEAPRLVLERGSTVVGRVVAADGSPAPGAIVSIPAPDGISHVLSALADGDGGYRIDGVPAGGHLAKAQHSTKGLQRRTVTIAEGENRIDFTLKPDEEQSIASGRVVDSGGAPVAGALVEVLEGSSVYSGGDGSFAVAVDPQKFVLTASMAGYAPAHLSHWAAGETLEGLELKLGPGVSLTGRLLGVAPEQAARVEITAGRWHLSRNAMIDSEGVYRITGLEPGTWWISARLEKWTTGMEIEIPPGEEEVVADLVIPERHEVRGRVLGPGGQPAQDADVTLIGGDIYENSGCDEEGAFSLAVPDGTYEVVAATADSSQAQGRVTVSGAPVEDLEIRLNGRADLTGHLFGIPEDEAGEVAVRVDPGQIDGSVAKDGSYTVGNLGPGTWTVTAGFGLARVTREITIRPGQESASLDLVFPPGGFTLSLRPTGYRGLEQGWVILSRDGDRLDSKTHPFKNGAVEFSHLAPGRYHLLVADDDNSVFAERTLDITASQELEIDLGNP